ncbi:pancreatic lipase-related protein 2-like [Styela clava]
MSRLTEGIVILLLFTIGAECQKVCYGPLGCFTNDAPFTSALLTEPLLPENRDAIDVTYSLFLRHQIPRDVRSIKNAAFSLANVTGPHKLSRDTKLSRKWRQLLVTTKQTKIIIHDYGDTDLNKWVFAMVERFLQRDDCHVITVNWKSRDGIGGYYQAAANIRVVGAEVALMLKNIKDWKPEFEFESVHLIGHGIGAHAASYVGDILKIDDVKCLTKQSREDDVTSDDEDAGWWQLPSWLRSSEPTQTEPKPKPCEKLPQLGQITGLDPAGLWFESAESGARLDSSDAIFVDVIHTDVIKKLTSYFGHGIARTSGDVDFYPNGGYDQPGCTDEQTGFENLEYQGSEGPRKPMDCNHLRSIVYYLSTMDPTSCHMTSFPCSSYREFQTGSCTSCVHNFEPESGSSTGWFSYLGFRKRRTSATKCLELGPEVPSFWREHKRRAREADSLVPNIKAFLKTRSTEPFCLKYIKIELELSEPVSEGILSFRLADHTNHKTDMIPVGRISNWGSTDNPTYLVTVPSEFGRLHDVTVLWQIGAASMTSWWPNIVGHSPNRADSRRELRLPLQNIKVLEMPLSEITNFCSSRRKLRSGKEVRFTQCGTEESSYHDYDDTEG